MKKKNILILYEMSGTFANLYRKAGFNVIVKDLQLDPENGDAVLTEYIPGGIYGLLAFPPCTQFAGSGARWWKKKGKDAIREGLAYVDACSRIVALYNPSFWLVENPVGRLKRWYGKPRLMFDPCDYGAYLHPFGDHYRKRTCLWGKFVIPAKKPVKISASRSFGKSTILLPRNDAGKLLPWTSLEAKNVRSKTPAGFAKAFFLANK
jgi:hypothetical protein